MFGIDKNNISLQNFEVSKNQPSETTQSYHSNPTNQGLSKDEVVLSTNSQENNGKLVGLATGFGAGALLIAGSLFGKKINIESAQKLLKQVSKQAEEIGKAVTQQAKKVVEEVKTPSTKKAQNVIKEETKAQEKARKLAEEARIKAENEARIKAEQRAKEIEQKRAETKAKIEAEKKAKAEAEAKAKAEAEAKIIAQRANRSLEYNTEKRLSQYIDPKSAVQHNTPKLESESYNDYFTRIRKKQEEIDVYDFADQIKDTKPETVFNVALEELEKCHKNGGNATIEDFFKILSSAKTRMDSTVRFLEEKNPYSVYRVENKFRDYGKYIDEMVAEIQATPKAEGESAPSVIRKALKNIERKSVARQKVVDEIAQSYEKELSTIRGRLQYGETSSMPKDVTLDRETKQKLADELNEILKSGGENPNYTADTPLLELQRAWKTKYISMPFSMENKQGETAILEMFPKYQGKATGEFKYEPLYRQMHIENPEEFVKQFETIGGEYAPGRLQSCSKEKLFGENWAGDHYGFTEWNPGNNVKFVIHPSGPVSKAADIGEGKYGSFEAIYTADSRFRILGTIKRTITPEEIKKGIPEFRNEFEDFQKYEIHLQEIV